MPVADEKHIDSEWRNYEYGYSWGHLLWKHIEERAAKRVDNLAAKYRQEVANTTKWTDTATNRSLLISRISNKMILQRCGAQQLSVSFRKSTSNYSRM